MLTGALLLVVPAVYGFRKSAAHRNAYAVFGTIWIGVIVAATVGNSPTPLVGYGGSAVLGYLLSLASIGPMAASRSGDEASFSERTQGSDTLRDSLRAA